MKTVYVIGAGASWEANLPTGLELKAKISKLLNIRFQSYQKVSGDDTIYQVIQNISAQTGQDSDNSSMLAKIFPKHFR